MTNTAMSAALYLMKIQCSVRIARGIGRIGQKVACNVTKDKG